MLGSPHGLARSTTPSQTSFLSRHGHTSMFIHSPNLHGRSESSTSVTGGTAAPSGEGDLVIGSIRFVPHVEFSSRLSLNFEPMERKMTDATHLKVGRFNEKSSNKASLTFKSKVVSRQHAEIWCEAGKWYIKDTKSSSGTFVNHIRLSPPGQESEPVVLNDGDGVQFGIDFRGGTEEVYRCVKTKIEVNRVFQFANDKFNRSAHKKLRSLTTGSAPQTPGTAGPLGTLPDLADDASTYTAECCICLFAIAPSQALFVAPCSHAYHFKCIRPLITQHYPNFLCCICRKYADLEASVEVESEAWIQSQAKDSDPRTPTLEREEIVFQSIIPDSNAQTISRSAPGDGPPLPLTAERGHVRHLSGTADPSILQASAIPMNRLVETLSLEPQMTPVNTSGPYLIDSGLE